MGLREIMSIAPHVFTPEEIWQIRIGTRRNEVRVSDGSEDRFIYSEVALVESHEELRLQLAQMTARYQEEVKRDQQYRREYIRLLSTTWPAQVANVGETEVPFAPSAEEDDDHA